MKPPDYEGITESVQRTGGQTRRVQVVKCSCEGCTAQIEMPVTNERKPPSVIFNIARRKDWSVNEGKREFLCPDHKKGSKMATTPKEPEVRQPTKEQRRLIFREIDENYSGKCYVSGVTDKSIGEKLKMPWAWVKEIREENFGPAGLDPAIQAAINKVEELEGRITKMETDALAAFEGSVRQIGDLTEQLKAVRSSLLRFAA